MTDYELIEVTKAYVALCNARRIDLILPLFAAGAVYRSTVNGELHGRAAIGDMMHQFFTKYTELNWQASQYHCENRSVGFNFSMTATTPQHEIVERRGNEQIEFTVDGAIKKIQVEIN